MGSDAISGNRIARFSKEEIDLSLPTAARSTRLSINDNAIKVN